MTIATTLNRVSYTANGVLVTFAYPFEIFLTTDLQVYVDGALKALTTDYSVSGAGAPTGGNVVFNTAPLNGAVIVILRVEPLTQVSALPSNDKFPTSVVEAALDKLTMLTQQLQEVDGRALKLKVSSLKQNIDVADPVALGYLQVDATGTSIQIVNSAGVVLSPGSPLFINVKDYGAKGDGVTNDRQAIVNAFGAATTGTVVYFPPTPNYYSVQNPNSAGDTMTPQPGTHLWGYGAKIQLDASPGSNGGEVLRIQNDDVTIEGLDISINAGIVATKGFSGVGIARRIADNVIPKRARVINCYIHGFKVAASSGGVGVNAEVGVDGLDLSGTFIDNVDVGLWLGTSTTYPLKDIVVNGLRISNVTNTPGDFNLAGAAVMISHNTAVDAIHPDTDDVNAVLTGISIRTAPIAFHVQGTGKVAMVGNIATGITSYGLYIEESQDVDFSHNTIGGALVNYVRNRQITGAYGSRRVRIVGNGFRGSASGAGMDTDGSLTRSWVMFNQMQSVSGARFTGFTAAANVVIDADETALTGQAEFISGLLLANNTGLNIRASSGTPAAIISLDNSNVVHIQRAGGADVATIPNTGNAFTLLGGMTYKRVVVAYSASITPDVSLGNEFDITATNNTAFTINAPANPLDGQRITITIRNTSGGVLGAITWNAVFKMLAFTSPTNGNSCSIDFRYDGTNWVQVAPQSLQIPN